MSLETSTVPCSICGIPIEIIPISGVREGWCPACMERGGNVAKARTVQDQRQREWQSLTRNFKAYLDTDLNRLPCPERLREAMTWHCGTKGLNLWGLPATGKTRTLFLLLKREFDAGHTFRAFGPCDFNLAIEKAGFHPAAFIESCRKADLLAFDDIGKVRMSPVIEGHFFAILEYRAANGKPCLFTHNFPSEAARAHRHLNGDTLESKFRNGNAVVRRIRDFCYHVEFKQSDIQFRT